jgi:adenylate kinase family enzyme
MILDGPTLYLFSGLPGHGKSTLAQAIAHDCKVPFCESTRSSRD